MLKFPGVSKTRSDTTYVRMMFQLRGHKTSNVVNGLKDKAQPASILWFKGGKIRRAVFYDFFINC
jgi:hypothetical protein